MFGGVGVRVVRAVCRLTGGSDISYLSRNFAIGGRPGRNLIERERVDSVLDLTPEAGPRPAGDCEYLKIPVENGSSPTLVQTFLILDWIDPRIKGGRKVLVHCSLGRGRAPFAAACYLMLKRNFTAVEALKTVRSKRRYTFLNKSQALSLMQFEQHLRARTEVPS